MSYEKKYGVGNVVVDAPYAHFIHELLLLSFGDVQHNINISLIYQSKESGNPFNIANGFKFNLQKRLIMNGNIPEKFEGGNGKLITLNNCSNRFVFDDGSQRIIRAENSTFVLENPDYSKEVYDASGKITEVWDKYGNKYLTYSYVNNKLDSVGYRNKTVKLNYNETTGMLESLEYICNNKTICTTTFMYSSGNVSVKHYCGVTYDISYSNGNFVACATADNNGDYSPHRLECTLSSTSLIVKETIGDTVVDKTTYDFIWNNDTDKFDIWDVTNYSGVKTRIQFKDGKPIYSYEVREDMFVKQSNSNEETPLDPYFGSVMYYDNNQVIGTQEYGEGTQMTYDGNGYQWEYSFAPAIEVKYVTISGWIYKKVENNISFNPISVSLDDTLTGEGDVDFIDNLPERQWVYYSHAFKMSELHSLRVRVRRDGDNIGLLSTKDFRITPHYENEEDDTPKVQTFVIGKVLAESETEIPLNPEPVEGAEDSEQPKVIFYNGNSRIDQDEYQITENDVIRFMINQVYGTHTDEIYFNNCKGVILSNNEDGLRVAYSDANGTTPIMDLKAARIEKRYSLKGNNYVTRIEFDSSSNAEYGMVVQSLCDDICYQAASYGRHHLDLLVSQNEGAVTYYTRNYCGLITSQKIVNSNNYELGTIHTTYDEDCTKVESTTDEFDQVTKYVTDDVWGVVTEVHLSDDTVIKDIYDGDMSTLLRKVVSKNNKERVYTFRYSNGYCAEISDGTLTYKFENGFTGADEEYSNVFKLNSTIEKHKKNMSARTVEDYFPNEQEPVYMWIQCFNEYGKLIHIGGTTAFQNNYDVTPKCLQGDACTTGINNASSKLASSRYYTSLLNNESREALTKKYEYDDGRVSKIGVFNKLDEIINEENFSYDDIGRMVTDEYVYDKSGGKSVSSEIQYNRSADDPCADNRAYVYSYKVNNQKKVDTFIFYDSFKRVDQKDLTFYDPMFWAQKFFTYDKTRVSKVTDKYRTGQVMGINEYTYDNRGRITKNTYASDTTASQENTYEYDEFGQLIREDNKTLDKTFVYEYNNIGNLTLVKEYDYYAPDDELPSCQKCVKYEYDSECPDKLTKFDGNVIEYNSIGCPSKYKDMNYEWANGKLSKIHRSTFIRDDEHYTTRTFTYDGYGRRTQKYYISGVKFSGEDAVNSYSWSHTNDYTYDNSGRLIREVRTDRGFSGEVSTIRELVYLYDESGMIGVMYSVNGDTPEPYYYHRNLQGDVIAIYDTNGEKQVEYAYDAWGNCETICRDTKALAETNPIRYRGYYYDTETKLYYLNARYYSPEWRRFISPDAAEYIDPETPNGLNLYAYCYNDPVNLVDPSGHDAEWYNVLALIGVGLVAAAATVLTLGAFGITVGGAGLLGAVIHGAAVGALIGAGGGIVLGAGGGMIYDVAVGNEFGTSIWAGIQAGFGIGAIAGAIIGGAYSYFSFGNFASTAKLNSHFSDHGKEFNGLYSNATEYAKGAKYTIRHGQKVTYMYKGKTTTGYIRFFGSGGKANYAFVGLNGSKTATFGIRSVSSLVKDLGLTIFGL